MSSGYYKAEILKHFGLRITLHSKTPKSLFFFNADYIYHFFFILEMKAEKGLKQTSTQVYISISQQSNYITCHLAAGNFYCRFGKK